MLAYEPTQEDRARWDQHLTMAPDRIRALAQRMPPWQILEADLPNDITVWGTMAAIDPRSGKIDIDVLLSVGHCIDKATGVDPDNVRLTTGDDVVGDDMRVATFLYRTGRIN